MPAPHPLFSLFARATLSMTLLCGAMDSSVSAQQVPPLRMLGASQPPEDPNRANLPREPIQPENLEEFRLLWAVSGGQPAPELLGPNGLIPAVRNVRMLYESWYGRLPSNLDHVVGQLNGGNGRWKQNYLEFLDGHLSAIRTYLQSSPIPDNEPWFCVIDWERFQFSWNATTRFSGLSGGPRWRAALREIHRGSLDQDFLRFVGFETTATTWEELELQNQTEELAKQSYIHFTRDFILRSLHVSRQYSPPGTKWGFYNYPISIINVYLDRGPDRVFRDIHDEMSWMWPAVDFLAPAFYRMPYLDPQRIYSPTLPQSTPQLLERYYRTNMDEVIRVRNRFAPKAAIIPFIWYHYHEAHPITVPHEQYFFLTPENASAQMIYPRLFGADSVFLWGTVADFYVANRGHAPYNEVVQHLRDHWAVPFHAAEDILRQNAGNNSP